MNENWFDKIQRIYQINVKNEKSNSSSKQIDEHNIDKNENENIYYEQYEKISNNNTNNFWLNVDAQYDFSYNNYDVNFVIYDINIIVIYKCQLCNINFFSKNKLFKHFRINCWQQTINHVFVINEFIVNQLIYKQ